VKRILADLLASLRKRARPFESAGAGARTAGMTGAEA
jgi:hypothetical protein